MENDGISAIEEDILGTYDYHLRDLADRAAEDVASLKEAQAIEDELAELVADAPDSIRTEIVKRFREMVRALQDEKGLFEELTPEQEKQLELLKEHEKHYIAHLLSDKALEKIRKMLLANPALMQQILGMGEELFKKGVFAGRAPDAAQMENLTTQPVRNADQQKDESRGR